MEGMHCHVNPACNTTGLTLPVWEYTQTNGRCAIIGGVVYRGDEIPDLVGTYLYRRFLYWSGFWVAVKPERLGKRCAV